MKMYLYSNTFHESKTILYTELLNNTGSDETATYRQMSCET